MTDEDPSCVARRRSLDYRGMTGLTSPTPVGREAIAAYLEEELLSGRLPGGMKLPSERQLAVRLGVSRPVVREVLRTLAERGLIEVSPGRGAYARDVQTADIAEPMAKMYRRRNATTRDLVEARMMLECEASAIAAERATPQDADELDVALARIEKATDIIERARADVAFHARIARASGNPVIEAMFASITGLAFEHMLRSHADTQIASEAHPFHVKVVEAIRSKDSAGARQAMRDHLAVATRRYGEDLNLAVEQLARRELDRMQLPDAVKATLLGEGRASDPAESDGA